MSTLEDRLAYKFQNKNLLETALTHSSYANENGVSSYERLEFLGDSILGMIVADFLYRHPSTLSEGELTRTRSVLVREESLVKMAEKLGVKSCIRLGKGEISQGPRPSICADVVEAIIAGISLDGGLARARELVHRHLLAEYTPDTTRSMDYKSILQEKVQRVKGNTITYALVKQIGPDHQREFTIHALINDTFYGEGIGKSKKEAEQQAAKAAITNWNHKKKKK